jgi:hypothetical protein
VQGLLGHTSPETTKRFYAPGQLERLAAATLTLEGRFGAETFLPSSARPVSGF